MVLGQGGGGEEGRVTFPLTYKLVRHELERFTGVTLVHSAKPEHSIPSCFLQIYLLGGYWTR